MKQKPFRRYALLGIGLGMATVALFQLGRNPSVSELSPESDPPPSPLSRLRALPLSSGLPLSGEENDDTSRLVTTDPRAQQLAQQLRAAMDRLESGQSPNQFFSRQPIPRLGDVDPSLLPKPARWSAEQSKTLSALNRRSGKQLTVRGEPNRNTVRYLKGLLLEPAAETPLPGKSLPESTAYNFLNTGKGLLQIDQPEQEFITSSETRDDLGYTQIRMEQTYQGLPVWPASLTVQLDPAGNATLMTGAYVPTPKQVDLEPDLSLEQAQVLAQNHLSTQTGNTLDFESQRLIVHAPLDGDLNLAYQLEVHAGPAEHWNILVQAQTGEILSSHSTVCTAAAPGSGTDLANQTKTLNLWQANNRFYMVDSSKPMFDANRSTPPNPQTTFGGILIFDAKNVDPQKNPNQYNPELISSTSATTGFDPAGVSAAVNLGKVFDYFSNRHQRNSIDGSGGSILGIVNVPIDNAYWHNGLITFGNVDRWALTLDFVAHEMTHGVIEKSANLVYENQPGAMNEAFADIFGESTEGWDAGRSPDWILGSFLKTGLRSMKDPASLEIANGRRYPTKMSEMITPNDPFLDNFKGRDNGGVHLNSSIINRAYYLVAEGLNNPLGMLNAERIFFRALTTKLQKQSQFIDCRLACIQSAEEIFGAGSTEAQRTAEAFNTVEIFDQVQTPAPNPLPTVSGEDATLFTFVSPLDGFTYLARQEFSQGDQPGGILMSEVPVAPGKRPVVSGDGSLAILVTAQNNIGILNTQNGQGELFGNPNTVWSVGLSGDGSLLGVVLRNSSGQPEDRINVIHLATEQTETYQLLAPALDGNAIDTILFADVMDFTPDGRRILYDALNRISFADGTQLDTWSLFTLDRATGNILEIIPPLPDLSVGNPSLGKAHGDRLVFEAEDFNQRISTVLILNLLSGDIFPVAEIDASLNLAFPDWFGDDRSVLYSDYAFDPFFGWLVASGLVRQPLGNDGFTPSGQGTLWIEGTDAGATLGTIYRRGAFQALPQLNVSVAQTMIPESSPQPIPFTITRSGPTTAELSFSFVLTGSASPQVDYQPVTLSGRFPPGATTFTVPIQPINDTLDEPNETIRLTFSEAPHYSIGTGASSEITLVDDDEAASGYDAWAAQNGIGARNLDDDNDGKRNLYEYWVGSNAKQPDTTGKLRGVLVSVGGQTYLGFEVARTAKPTGVTYQVQASNGLPKTGQPSNWTNVTGQTTVLEDSATTLRVRLNTPITGASPRFLRIQLNTP